MNGELERQERTIVFEHVSIVPGDRLPWTHRAALLLNPCDGYHHVFARFGAEGEFTGFFDWIGTEPYTAAHYVAWALLPNEIRLIEHFDPKRRIQSHGRDDVTGKGATSENAEGTPASPEPNEQEGAA